MVLSDTEQFNTSQHTGNEGKAGSSLSQNKMVNLAPAQRRDDLLNKLRLSLFYLRVLETFGVPLPSPTSRSSSVCNETLRSAAGGVETWRCSAPLIAASRLQS